MVPMIFYTNPMSRGRIARWMLEEVNAQYETRVLDYGQPMKTEAFLAINPMGKVPVIQHGAIVVTECPAIIAYLADVFPQAGLAPQDDAERAAYYRWLFFAAGPLEASVSDRSLGFEVPAEKRRTVGYGSYELVIDALEKAVSGSAYIAGERFTGADVYVGSHLMWGMQFGSIEKRPAFEAYVDRVYHRPAHVRASELDDALVKPSS